MPIQNIRLDDFPELRAMLERRDREKHVIRNGRQISLPQSDAILGFWQTLAGELEKEDDLEDMERLVRELQSDIDMLRALKGSLEMQKDDPATASQIQLVVRMLLMLLDILDGLKKRWRFLKDRALAYFMAVNRAIPSKVQNQMDADKDKDKTGKKASQKKAKRALDETKKKPDKPDKKMQA